MRLPTRFVLLSTFLLLPFAVSCRSATSVMSARGWTTHNDPSGFSVATPDGWSVAADSRQGRIKLQGTHGEQVVIWPIFIEQKQLNATGAARLVMQLARRLDNSLAWTPANATGNAARVITKAASHSGATLLTWSNTSNGAAVMFYELQAPPDVYRSSADTFTHILQSFRGSTESAPAQGGGHASSGPVTLCQLEGPTGRRIHASGAARMASGGRRLSLDSHRRSQHSHHDLARRANAHLLRGLKYRRFH